MAPVATSGKYVASASDVQKYNVLEDYHGGYRFAPIEEAQVSRAMIKRWAVYHIHIVDDSNTENWVDTLTPCTRERCPTWSSLEQGVPDFLVHII